MADLVLTGLTEKEIAEIEFLAAQEADALGIYPPPAVADFAAALLKSHLVLIRDCPGILPNRGKGAAKIKGRGGVSLGAGINAAL